MRSTTILAAVLGLAIAGTVGCGGGTGGTSSSTRSLTGTVSAEVVTTSVNAKTAQVEKATLTCTDLQVCCAGYDGKITAAKVDENCNFTVPLPLETFCYCGFFSGTDSDSDGCKDTYAGSLGCAARGYSGALPIFQAADDATSAISLGTLSLQGQTFVPATDPCAQVDSDNDGTADSTDSDDDGDGVADSTDAAWSGGCLTADDYDGNSDNIPDIFQSAWDDLADADGDNSPDFCDVSTDCTASSTDTDADCIPDSLDSCESDDDSDSVPDCIDCNPKSASETTGCYLTALCELDLDADGVGICSDCDDFDVTNTLTLAAGCGVTCASDSKACDNDFECQLFADNNQTDSFTTANSRCRNGCCKVVE